MSISPDNLPKVEVPDTMPDYREDEKAHARRVQDEHKGEIAKKNKGHALIGGVALAIVGTVVFGGQKLGLFGGGDASAENPAPTPDKTTSATATPTIEATAKPEVEPLQLSPVILSSEERQLWDSSRFEQEKLSVPVLDNIQGVLTDIIDKGVDYDEIDFSSVTENNDTKVELRSIAQNILEQSPSAESIKIYLPAGESNETDGTVFGDSLITSLTAEDGVMTVRISTPEDPNGELSANNIEFVMNSHLEIDSENKLTLEKDLDQ